MLSPGKSKLEVILWCTLSKKIKGMIHGYRRAHGEKAMKIKERRVWILSIEEKNHHMVKYGHHAIPSAEITEGLNKEKTFME